MPSEQLPRIDPENRLGLDFHAPRTLRRFEGMATEARRPAIMEAKFRNTDAHQGEADRTRTRLLQMLDLIEGKLTPEQFRLQEIVRSQFAGELAVLREFGLYDAEHPKEGDAPPSNAETVFQILLTKLTPVQVAEILKRAKQPQLQLEAVTSFERYVAALDAHPKMPGQIGTYVNQNLRAAWAAQDAAAGIEDTIVGWNVGIIDGTQELDADRELRGNLGQKLTQAEGKLQSVGLRLPHPRRYALAQMRALKQGKPLDVVNWSALNDDTCDHSVVPGGGWNVRQVDFGEDGPGSQRVNVRFRPEVVVKA